MEVNNYFNFPGSKYKQALLYNTRIPISSVNQPSARHQCTACTPLGRVVPGYIELIQFHRQQTLVHGTCSIGALDSMLTNHEMGFGKLDI